MTTFFHRRANRANDLRVAVLATLLVFGICVSSHANAQTFSGLMISERAAASQGVANWRVGSGLKLTTSQGKLMLATGTGERLGELALPSQGPGTDLDAYATLVERTSDRRARRLR
ncbi:MAG: hypothetical protein AAGF74_16435 [Pseudomonadota bacterium]